MIGRGEEFVLFGRTPSEGVDRIFTGGKSAVFPRPNVLGMHPRNGLLYFTHAGSSPRNYYLAAIATDLTTVDRYGPFNLADGFLTRATKMCFLDGRIENAMFSTHDSGKEIVQVDSRRIGGNYHEIKELAVAPDYSRKGFVASDPSPRRDFAMVEGEEVATSYYVERLRLGQRTNFSAVLVEKTGAMEVRIGNQQIRNGYLHPVGWISPPPIVSENSDTITFLLPRVKGTVVSLFRVVVRC